MDDMTQNVIVERAEEIARRVSKGEPLARALKALYRRRYIAVKYPDTWAALSLDYLDLDNRSHGALARNGIKTIGEVVELAERAKWYESVPGLGKTSAMRVLEALLNFSWDFMDTDERATFLVNFVIDNCIHYKKEVN